MDFFFRIFFKLKVYEKGNLLKEKFILCPNHTSYLDGFIILSAVNFRLKCNLFFIGLSKYFNVPIVRGLVKYLRVIPVDASHNLTEAMKAASLVLKNKKILCIFPEGSRSIDGQIKEFKKGAGILAKELDIKIIPVYIEGAYRAWKSTVSLPRPNPVRVIFGKAKSFQELKEKGLILKKEADEYQAISLGIEEEVRQLSEKLSTGRCLPGR